MERNKKAIASALLMAFVLATTVFTFRDNIAEAASSVWQCMNCGRQETWGGNGHPTSSYGCGGDINKRHVWQRIK